MKPAVGKVPPKLDPAQDVLRSERHPLDAIFHPQSVAVIGATDRAGSVGRAVLWNLLSSPFGGTVYPINPKRGNVLGIKAYRDIASVPEKIDLACVITPAETVPGVVRECVAGGVRGCIIISAGFKEHGERGAALEREIMDVIRGTRMRIIGPNCLGVMNPLNGFNATFAQTIARAGNVAFISQSGALCTAILDWSLREMVGFSAFVSVGSMLDVGWGDLIDYLGNDPRTRSIVIYMESVGDAPSFLSAAREVSLTKPIIVIKAGRNDEAARAAASHTGALTGSDEVLEAAFRRCGVLRVTAISDLFYMADVLSKQPRPRGPRLVIVTNAGGPGVLATDALIATGGELAPLAKESLDAFDKLLPPHWSHNNPVDILGDADPKRFAAALEIAAKDPNCDGMLMITAPQGMTDPTQTAELLKPYARSTGKPVLASFMGGAEMAAGVEILNRAGIPTFAFPDTAARAFNYMWRFSYNLKGLYETPHFQEDVEKKLDRAGAELIVQRGRQSGRTLLSEYESKQLLKAYAIPTVETRLAQNEDEAARCAADIGYPVVLKLHSQTITHKSDVRGVQLNLLDEKSVREAYREVEQEVTSRRGPGHFLGVTVQPMVKLDGYELIIGSIVDPQFGPVLLFGTGGQLVEVFRDRALALPPLNTTLARRMMEQTRIFAALQGVRGRKPVDVMQVCEVLVRFSQMVVEHPWIREIDINPLLASPERLLALDARVVLHDSSIAEDKLPRSAIRPYPAQYISTWASKSGVELLIRPIRPEDEPEVVKFHEGLSERSVYLRYFQPLKLSHRTSHERLTRICFIDYNREMALVAERKTPQTGEAEIMGIGRLSKLHGLNEAEAAALVRDEFQHQGLGSELFRRLLEVARDERVDRVVANTLAENREMRGILQKLGFKIKVDMEDQLVEAALRL